MQKRTRLCALCGLGRRCLHDRGIRETDRAALNSAGELFHADCYRIRYGEDPPHTEEPEYVGSRRRRTARIWHQKLFGCYGMGKKR